MTLGRLAPLYYALRTGPAVPASQQEARLDPLPLLPENATACGFRSRKVRSLHNLLLPSKPVEATAIVSRRDRLSQGPGSGQVTDYLDTYGRHRMPVDRMGGQWKHARPCRKRSCPALRRTSFPWRIFRLGMIPTRHPYTSRSNVDTYKYCWKWAGDCGLVSEHLPGADSPASRNIYFAGGTRLAGGEPGEPLPGDSNRASFKRQ